MGHHQSSSALTADDEGLSFDNAGYLAFHRPRFALVVQLVEQEINNRGRRVLDIGPSPLTDLLRHRLGFPVDTMGLEAENETSVGRHFRFDLNEAQERDRWRTDVGPYDLIVFAEVIEHLYTAPELVLSYLRHLLGPGGVLLIQTPNATSLRKRVKLALGQNPFEPIRISRSNPGHFREYTLSELTELLGRAGFRVRQHWMRFYFDARFALHHAGDERPRILRGTLSNAIYRVLPPSLREGITIIAE
jgi:trans-aconitate methyltransferase